MPPGKEQVDSHRAVLRHRVGQYVSRLIYLHGGVVGWVQHRITGDGKPLLSYYVVRPQKNGPESR
jgi:hypothetical protein